jgi:hypothetical protein
MTLPHPSSCIPQSPMHGWGEHEWMPQTLGTPPPPQGIPVGQTPHLTRLPHPSGITPQFAGGGQGWGVHTPPSPQTLGTPPPPQVSPGAQVPHEMVLQPSSKSPHCMLAGHGVGAGHT